MDKLQNFLMAVEGQYDENLMYHNSIHATDVLQMMHIFMKKGAMKKCLSKMDALTLCTATICHDIGHLGVSNGYLINVKHELAVTYNDIVSLCGAYVWCTTDL